MTPALRGILGGLAFGLAFAPAAWALAPEEVLRMEVCLNGAWESASGGDDSQPPEMGWTIARIPALPLTREGHPAAMWYRRSLEVPRAPGQPERRFFLEIEKAGHYVGVYCNGKKVGEHFGQFSPFEVELTGAIRPGERNEIALFVHDASGRYVREGTEITDALIGPAYRPGARGAPERNWIGIAGDITFSWRPARHIAEALAITSVREKSLLARVELSPNLTTQPGIECRAAVLDGDNLVLSLPAVAVSKPQVELRAGWQDPVLWGHAPYGEPKLYWLRVELLQGGTVIDRRFTRFGFRELWIDGKDLLLNGKKLWLTGTYGLWLDTRRYINDRRPMAAELRAMQETGLNTLNGHWDDLGRTYLELCDEMGVLVWASMYCNSQLPFQPNADQGWADWMARTTGDWVRSRRAHPSVVAWRPFCATPRNLNQFTSLPEFVGMVRRAVNEADGTRPVGDGSHLTAHNQGMTARAGTGYDDGTQAAERVQQSAKPTVTVEIWGDFRDVNGVMGFFRDFERNVFKVGSTGYIPQHLPFVETARFTPMWLSDSGPGNRDTDGRVAQRCVNWCDPQQPAYRETPYGKLFAEMYREQTGASLPVSTGPQRPELLVSALPANEPVYLISSDPLRLPAIGLVAASDGTAWFVAPDAGRYTLSYRGGQREIEIARRPAYSGPGYDAVQRLSLAKE